MAITALQVAASGQTASYRIDVDLDGQDGDDTTLTSLAARDDTSNVLAALGINAFFVGTDASDIAVNDAIAARAELLAASSVNISGDGANAGLLAAAGGNTVAELNNATLFDFHNQTLGQMSVRTAVAAAKLEGAEATSAALQQQRASISGVSLGEEAVDLLR